MTRGARRRRGAVLLALAVATGGLASSRVERRERGIEERVGPPVPVVVAAADLRQGQKIDERTARALSVRQVPERFAPPDGLTSAEDAVGATLAAPVAAGGYVTAGALAAPGGEAGDERGAALAPGQRAVEIAAAGGEELAEAGPGAQVDVIVTSERGEGRGRTYLALEAVELLSARPGAETGAAPDADAGPTTLATLRVTLRQAVFLAAAQSFAREIRLLPRAPGERRRGGPVVVESGAL